MNAFVFELGLDSVFRKVWSADRTSQIDHLKIEASGGVRVGTSIAAKCVFPGLRSAVLAIAAAVLALGSASGPAQAGNPTHEGVASCGGSACHSRTVATPPDIRHDEIRIWQDPTRPSGAHSRAWRVLTEPRGEAIAARLGLGRAETAKACLGCHSDNAARRGETYQASDGVGCEACHGGSGDWLASHYAANVSHKDNLARGMIALEDPKARAAVCLDCHFGSSAPGQFVTHEIMSAGHPRVQYELDLFSTLQKHYDLGPAYAARKPIASGVKVWAVGQSMALERSLTLFSDTKHGQKGAFPEFYFFDCHSCHRAFSDDPKFRPTAVANPSRPIPSGQPPYNDENLIVLSAAAKVVAPHLSDAYEANVQAFHKALATDRQSAVRAAGQLAASTKALTGAFAGHDFNRDETLAILRQVVGDPQSARYTDYTGGAQAVMAVDTLLNALSSSGQLSGGALAAIRPDVDRAYAAVNDPNGFRPAEFRTAMARLAQDVRAIR